MSKWKMVPVEPTDEMIRAIDGLICSSYLWPVYAYRAMLDAAPAAPQQAEPVAWRDPSNKSPRQAVTFSKADRDEWPHIYKEPLYLHPPAAEVQRLRDAAGGVLAIVESIGRRAFTLDGWMTVQELRRALEGGE